MKPIHLVGLVLLALTLAFAVLGVVLARINRLRVRNAARFTRICTLVVLVAAYGLTQYDWPGVHLRQVDFWSLMAILGIAAYALIWAPIAHYLNRYHHDEFAESFMLSMLYSDTEHASKQEPGDKRPEGRKKV
jgi:hypothetical protein